jgi:N-acetylneuraminic acid mutarotase
MLRRFWVAVAVLLVLSTVSSSSMSAQTAAADWVWQNGSKQFNKNPVFGTLQVPSAAATPGSRSGMASWTDDSGNLWIFGGGLLYGYNDVWEFNSTTMEWAWMAGPNLPSQPAVYGTLGLAASANVPGVRTGSVTWKDKSGNFWLFGGEGSDSAGNYGYLNDLWMFNPSTLLWTWVGGSSVLPTCPVTNSCGSTGVYGTLGAASPKNVPPGRSDALGWTDGNGNFWLFGGRIYIVYLNGWGGYENDLWKYSPSTNEWTWMGGNDSLPSDCTLNDSCGWGGTYGTQGTPSASNLPGSREASTTWTDANGDLWLFGGFGYDSTHIRGDLNDLWKFTPSTGAWEWVSGSDTVGGKTYDGPSGVYGTKGSASAANHPGGRTSAKGWIDQSNDLCLFGGDGYDASDNFGFLGDLWMYSPSTNQWTWMTGSTATEPPASYGILGAPSAANDPGNRVGFVTWADRAGNLWLFGGDFFDSLFQNGSLDDVWEYQSGEPAQAAAIPTFSLPPGVYVAPQSVTISDATPGATLYYTTDGSTPGTSSARYTGPLAVSRTETLQAIATADGFSPSPVASASYTINLAPPNFTLATSTTRLIVRSGTTGAVTLTVTPQNGFSSAVNFACSDMPPGTDCTFSDRTVTPSGAPATTQLTIAARAVASSGRPERTLLLPDAAVLVAGVLLFWRKRRPIGFWIPMLLLSSGLFLFSGCSSVTWLPGTTTVTITAQAGSLRQTAKIALTVNH